MSQIKEDRIESYKNYYHSKDHDDTTKLKLLYNISKNYWQVNPDSGLVYAYRALEFAQKINSKPFIISAFNCIGVCHQLCNENNKALSNFDSALYYTEFIENAMAIKARIYSNRASSYKNIGNYEEAITNAINSLKIHVKNNDSLGIAQVNLRIANLYDHMGRFDEKVYYDKKAKEYDNGKITAHIYQAIGLDFFRHLARYDSATHYLESALTICDSTGASRTRYSIQANLAQVQAVQGKLDEATQNCLESMVVAKQFNDAGTLALIYNQLGNIYSLKKDNPKSLECFEIAKDYLKINGTTIQRKVILKQIAELYAEMGEYEDAYKYQKQYSLFIDSLTTQDYQQEVKRITSIYNYEKVEQDNTILKLENNYSKSMIQHQTTQKRLWAFALFWVAAFCILLAYLFQKNHIQLRKVETERNTIKEESTNKDRIFSIISHDLKSPFNSIIGLSELMVTDYHNLDDQKKLVYLKQIQKASTSSYSLLENLLSWAQIQFKGASISKRPQKLYALAQHAIIETQQPINKNIIINNLIPNNTQVYCDDSIIVMTLRNLLSNAIKFSTPNQTISIYSEKKGNKIKVLVKDQGVGISPARIANLFIGDKKNSTLGTNNEKGTGIGLSFCQELLQSHNTELKVESELGIGTTFWFTLSSKPNDIVL